MKSPNTHSVPQPGVFTRFIHVWYSQSAAISYFFSRRFLPAGVGIVIVIVLTAGLGIGYRKEPVYQIFSLAVGMFCLSIPWAFLRRAKIQAKRELPLYATAGETIRYTIRATNTGRWNLRRAWLMETPPDPRPSLLEFFLRREPGEEDRNLFDRTFAFYRWRWLIDTRRAFHEEESVDMLNLEPGKTSRVVATITPTHRGVILLNDLRALLPDPFGILQNCVKVTAPPSTLTVLPKRYPLPNFEMPGGSRFQTGDENATNEIGSNGEFVGLRDYRPGDPLRQIHWKSWARTGRPIVKELEDTFYPRYGLILDTFLTGSNEELFEDAVSVAASFIALIDRSDSLLDLMFIKDEAHLVTAGRGLARTEKLLEVLAGVEGDHEHQFHQLSQLVLKHRENLTSCIVIFAGWDHERLSLLESLVKNGIICVPIIIGEGEKPANLPGYWLRSNHIGPDLLKLPSKLSYFS